jgi:cation:H+ antiporter
VTNAWLSLLGGFICLFAGADALVRGASSLALRLGLTPLVIGLTVVAFGTSAPELVVSIQAALAGQGDIAVANVVGSNIFNIAVILGLAAVILPLRVQFQLIRFDTPVMVGVALLGAVCLLDGRLGRVEAGLFVALLVAYTVINVRLARRQATAEVEQEFAAQIGSAPRRAWMDLLLILGGLGLLVLGSHWLVGGAVQLARSWGMSEALIGLTIIAAGTSLPELATSVVAALRRASDIAIGNIVGSNIYNVLGILGTSALIAPLHAPGLLLLDLAIMVGLGLVLLPIIIWGRDVNRWEGAFLLASYGGYLWLRWPAAG